jgi:D-alanyl-lipoteichoic acid acyltransferase DltB (MBOAT superfamily)
MESETFPRKKIVVRLFYTVFFFIVFEILKIIIQVSVLFQYVYLLISKTYNNPVRNFTNKVSIYAYKVLRYVTLNENEKPYPFHDFPEEMELPEGEVFFE